MTFFKMFFKNLFLDRGAEERETLRRAQRRVALSLQETQGRLVEAQQNAHDSRQRIKEALRSGQHQQAKMHARLAAYREGRLTRISNMLVLLEVLSHRIADQSQFKNTLDILGGTISLKHDVTSIESAFERFEQGLERDQNVHTAVAESLGLTMNVDSEAPTPDKLLHEIAAELESSTDDMARREADLTGTLEEGRAAVRRLQSAVAAEKKRSE